MNLDQFIATVREKDVARSNRFVFTMSLPRVLSDQSQTVRQLSLMTESVTLPGASISTTDGSGIGQTVFTPYASTLGDTFPISFYVDGDYDNRWYFDQWIQMMNNPETGEVLFFDDVKVSAHLEMLDQSDKGIYAWDFFDMIPVQIISSGASQDAGANAMKLTISFKYRYWNIAAPMETAAMPTLPSDWDKVKGLFHKVKPYISARYPGYGKMENVFNQAKIAAKVLGSF